MNVPHIGPKGQKGQKSNSACIYRDFWFRRNKGHEGHKGQKQKAAVLMSYTKGEGRNENDPEES